MTRPSAKETQETKIVESNSLNENSDDIVETCPMQVENSEKKQPSQNRSFCAQIERIILAICAVIIILLIGFVIKNAEDIKEIKNPEPVMLYQPTDEYLEMKERPTIIDWKLFKEHSQKPFHQHNASHLQVNKDGFYRLSCSLLMETRENKTNVMTLFLYYANNKQVYTKITSSKVKGRYPITLSLNLYLKQSEYIYVEVNLPKYILKGPGGNYLTIAFDQFIEF